MNSRAGGRGQSVIELALVGFWVSVFFGLMYYIATVFEVGQKQTMLLRSQAFIELGNFSYFGLAGHGKDDAKESKSHVNFSLGTKAQGVKVNLDKIEDFKKAVDGDLELDGVLSPQNDVYWNAFQFPKRRTTIQWLTGSGNSEFESELTAQLSIAHNRSLDLTKSMDPQDYKLTGMYSGGLTLRQFAQIASLQDRVESGLVDNVEQVKRALKQLVKDDSSLSDEAEEIESKFNVTQDAITGGAVASLINLAISAVAQVGFEALGNALDAGKAAGSSASASAGSAGSSGAQSGLFERIANNFTDPYTSIGNAVDGSFFTAPLESITSPVTQGLSNISSGLSSTGGGLFQTMKGISQIGQTAQLGMALAGQDTRTLGMITSGLAIPSAVSEGFQALDSAFNSPASSALNTSAAGAISNATSAATVNWVGVAQALPGITQPITTFLSLAMPELSKTLGIVNTAVGLLNVGVNLPGQVETLSNATKASQFLTAGGQLTAGVGQLVAGVSQVAGKDAMIGNIMMLAGGAMQGAGSITKFVGDLKVQGIDVSNPFTVAGELVKSNFDNIGKSFTNMKDSLANSVSGISSGLSNVFSSQPQIAEGKDFMKSAKNLADKGTGVFSDDRFSTSTSVLNTMKAENTIGELEKNFDMQMKGYGVEPGQYSKEFENIRKGFDTLQAAKSGAELSVAQMQALNDAKESSDKLTDVFNKAFGEDIVKQKQLRGMMYHNDQWSLAKNMLDAGQNYDDVKKMETEQDTKSSYGWIMSRLKAGAKTDKIYSEQIVKAYDILYVDAIDKEYKNAKERKKEEYKAAEKLADAAESISVYNPIYTEDREILKATAGKSAEFLENVLAERKDLDDKTRKRFEAAQRKIEDISNGVIAMESGKQRLGRLRAEIQERVNLSNRTRVILEHCAAGNCHPEIN